MTDKMSLLLGRVCRLAAAAAVCGPLVLAAPVKARTPRFPDASVTRTRSPSGYAYMAGGIGLAAQRAMERPAVARRARNPLIAAAGTLQDRPVQGSAERQVEHRKRQQGIGVQVKSFQDNPDWLRKLLRVKAKAARFFHENEQETAAILDGLGARYQRFASEAELCGQVAAEIRSVVTRIGPGVKGG